MATLEDVILLGPFSLLSYEIVIHILTFVDGLDLIAWAPVNSRWHALAHEEGYCERKFRLKNPSLLLNRGPNWRRAFMDRADGAARHISPSLSFKDVLDISGPGDVLIFDAGVHLIRSMAMSKRMEIIGDGPTPASTLLQSALGTMADLTFFGCWIRLANLSFIGGSVVAGKGCLEVESCRLEADVIVRDCALLYGCNLMSPTGPAAVLADKKTRVSLVALSGTGVRHLGLECVMFDNIVTACMRDGIILGGHGHLENNRVYNNGGVGVRVYNYLKKDPPMCNNIINDNALGDIIVN